MSSVTPPNQSSSAAPPSSSPPSSTAAPVAAPVNVSAITAQAVAAAQGANVGFEVFDHLTGQVVLQHNASMVFSTASLVKLLIAIDLLNQNNGSLSNAETTQVQTMLSASDDGIADTLWEQDGGPEIMTRAANLIGLTSTQPPADPQLWGNTTTTAADMITVYRYLLDRAPASYRNLIMTALWNATPTGADGFDQSFGIPDAVGTLPWAVKQGWSCCTQPPPLPDGVVLHTTGTVGANNRYIVVVLTDYDASTTWSTASQRTTDVVRALLPAMPG
jgi:beta-lactamase class A